VLKAIVTGYWRSGTTLLWQLVKLSNPDMLHLYEPFHEALFDRIRDHPMGDPEPLHGIPVWDDYHLLPEGVLEELRRRHRGMGFTPVVDLGAAVSYLDVVHGLPEPVVIKANRLCLVAGPVAERYGAGLVHVVRNPVDTFRSVLRAYPMRRVLEIARGLSGPDRDEFYTIRVYGVLRRMGLAGEAECFTDMFLWDWGVMNEAVVGHPRARVIYYEDLVERPGEAVGELSGALGIPVALKVRVRRTSLYRFPEELPRILIARAEALGIARDVRRLLPRRILSRLGW